MKEARIRLTKKHLQAMLGLETEITNMTYEPERGFLCVYTVGDEYDELEEGEEVPFLLKNKGQKWQLKSKFCERQDIKKLFTESL